MDERRLALIRGGDVGTYHRVGTGYLITPRLVLTARHVVVDKSDGKPWPRIDIRVGHPRESIESRCKATVLWYPENRDVALLLLRHPVKVSGTVTWGRPVGKAPLRYDALGYPLATVKNGHRNVEHLRGELPPLAGGAGPQDLYVLDQRLAPGMRPDGQQAWSGASGSAVFCEGHLIGVVIHDDDAFENRRLRACPARSFTSDPYFVDLLQGYDGARPQLVDISAPPSSAANAESEGDIPCDRPTTLSALTAAEEDLVPFLRNLLGDPVARADSVRELGQRLGYGVPDDYAPSVLEVAHLLSRHRRALATLSESLASGLGSDVARTELTSLLRGR